MRIFAANLSNNVSAKDIREAFEGFGWVMDVVLVRRSMTDRSRGVAFLEMPLHDEGTAAVFELNCFVLKGQAMVVAEMRTVAAAGTAPSGGKTRDRGGTAKKNRLEGGMTRSTVKGVALEGF